MQNSGSTKQNEIVSVNLSLAQCRLLQSLLDVELFEAEAKTSRFNENALKALYDVFYEKNKPAPQHPDADVELWLSRLEARRYAHGE